MYLPDTHILRIPCAFSNQLKRKRYVGKNLCKVGFVACVLCAGTTSAQAQDWKSILSGVANTVAEKVTGVSTFSLEGTWTYVGPDCKFESDNVLAKVGSEIAAKK